MSKLKITIRWSEIWNQRRVSNLTKNWGWRSSWMTVWTDKHNDRFFLIFFSKYHTSLIWSSATAPTTAIIIAPTTSDLLLLAFISLFSLAVKPRFRGHQSKISIFCRPGWYAPGLCIWHKDWIGLLWSEGSKSIIMFYAEFKLFTFRVLWAIFVVAETELVIWQADFSLSLCSKWMKLKIGPRTQTSLGFTDFHINCFQLCSCSFQFIFLRSYSCIQSFLLSYHFFLLFLYLFEILFHIFQFIFSADKIDFKLLHVML